MESKLFRQQIVVTGSIGCGKSRVAQYLSEILGLEYVDVDVIAKDIMAFGGVGLQAIGQYDSSFLSADGSLDRSKLREAIFNDKSVRNTIDSLIHPLIQTALLTILQREKKKCVIEIPLLFESGWDELFGTIVVVSANQAICVERIMVRDQVSCSAATKAHDSQMDSSVKKTRAHFVIENNEDWLTTVKIINEIAEKMIV